MFKRWLLKEWDLTEFDKKVPNIPIDIGYTFIKLLYMLEMQVLGKDMIKNCRLEFDV